MKRTRRPDGLLERARGFLEPTAEDEARVRQALGERLANDSGVHASEPSSALASRARPAMKRGSPQPVHLLIVGLATGIVGFLLGLAVDRPYERLPAAPAAPTAVAPVAPAESSEPSEPVAAPSASLPPSAAEPSMPPASRREAAAAPRAPGDTRAQRRPPSHRTPRAALPRRPEAGEPAQPSEARVAELSALGAPFELRAALELLRRAEQERRGGHPESALTLLGELESRAPRLLVEERLVTAALSECDLGNTERARALARSVVLENQSSIYARRLRSSCAAREPRR
jgi:hypothetical protein